MTTPPIPWPDLEFNEDNKIGIKVTPLLAALALTMRLEGLIPAMESAHAFAQAFREAPSLPQDEAIIINMSGRGDKDIFTIAQAFRDPSWQRFIVAKGEEYKQALHQEAGE